MKRTILTLLAATLATLAPLTQAAGDKPQRLSGDKFDAVDTNKDGGITREEAAAAPRLAETFDAIDADKDGRILPAELKAYAKTHRGKAMEKLDSNQDGMLSRDEAAQSKKAMQRFDAADTNKDGQVTPEEAKAAKGK